MFICPVDFLKTGGDLALVIYQINQKETCLDLSFLRFSSSEKLEI